MFPKYVFYIFWATYELSRKTLPFWSAFPPSVDVLEYLFLNFKKKAAHSRLSPQVAIKIKLIHKETFATTARLYEGVGTSQQQRHHSSIKYGLLCISLILFATWGQCDYIGQMIINNGQIYFEGVAAAEIARVYGTPTYVYEENKIRQNFLKAFNAFKKYYNNFKFYYAVKGCSNPAIIKILKQEGAGIDAASINEILLANQVGITGEDIIFSGNYLSDEDLEQGLKSKVIFNLDDISLFPRLMKIGKPEIISFRINPGYGYSDLGTFVTLGGENAKFGIHPNQVLDAYKMAKDAGIKRFGTHMMPGSCVRNPQYFEYVTGLLMDLIGTVGKKLNIDFEFVDLGGGLGIPYTEEEQELDIDETAKLVSEVFRIKLDKYNLKAPKLLMEPARYFVGNAGYIVGKVHTIKRTYQQIVGTDVGMNVLVRPVMYDSYHRIYVNGKEQSPRVKMSLCGQICENTDLWVKNRELPKDIQESDLIVVENAGAYGHCMSYAYNGRLRPAEVLVNGDKHYLIKQREQFEDMISGVSIPEHLRS